MKYKYFQDSLATGSLPLLVAILVAAAYWWLVPSGVPERVPCALLAGLKDAFPAYVWRIAGYGFYAAGALLLAGITVHHALIRVHSTFYITLFVWLSAGLLPHTLHEGSVLTCCLLAMCFFLFHTYQRVEPVEILFQGFFFYAVGTLFFPPALWLLPFLLGFQTWFHHLTPRVVFAMLAGVSLPYWFLFGYAYTVDDVELFLAPLREAVAWMPVDYASLTSIQVVGLVVVGVFTLWSCVLYAGSSYQDKIRTRTFIYHVMAVEALLFVFLLLQPQHYAVLMAPVVTCCSLLAGHYFAVSRDRRSFVASLVVLVVSVALYIFNLWTQLYSSF